MPPTKEEKAKMEDLLKQQATNGSFELNDRLCKTVGLSLEAMIKEKNEKSFNDKAWATALAMEFIDKKLASLKNDNIKAFDKAKLFLFKVWADSQPFLKTAAMAQFAPVKIKGVDGDGRPIV